MVGYDSQQADDAGNLMAEIIVDLEQPQTFDRVRIAGSIQRIRGRADRLEVAVRNDLGGDWHDAGSSSAYRLGFLEVNLPKVATARYVRLRIYKHFPTDINKSWQDSWLLLDEIEIAAARYGEMGPVEALPGIIQK